MQWNQHYISELFYRIFVQRKGEWPLPQGVGLPFQLRSARLPSRILIELPIYYERKKMCDSIRHLLGSREEPVSGKAIGQLPRSGSELQPACPGTLFSCIIALIKSSQL